MDKGQSMTTKQILGYALPILLVLVGVGYEAVLSLRAVESTLVQVEKKQDRILDSVEDINRMIDWTER